MVKRKILTTESEDPFKVKKKKVSVSSSDDTGKLICTSPNKLIGSLLGDTKPNDFFETYWEKKPLVVKRKDPSFYGNMVSIDILKDVLKSNELSFESDVNVCRYVDNEKELLNEDGEVKPKDLDRLMNKKKATFQFFHCQRYVDELWNIVEKLETYFGSLVGSSVDVTPGKSQGLAPHCDDVESFVLQLEGSQKWRLYKPMVELSRDYTQDLLEETIGEPTMEVTLEKGDLLYFPRGVIHQSANEDAGHSAHLVLTTYQQNSWGDFMNHAVSQAIEKALEDDVSFRTGLPTNYLSILGTGKDMSTYVEDESEEKAKVKLSNVDTEHVKEFKKCVKSHLAKLVDHIDVNTAADAMCADFMASRLPPYGYVPKEDTGEDNETVPKLNHKIKIKYPEHIRIVYENEEEKDEESDDEEDMEEDEEKPAQSKLPKSPKKSALKTAKTEDEDDDDEDEDADVDEVEPHIKVFHSLENDRFSHMGGDSIFEEGTGGCIKLHVSFAKAVIDVVNSKDFIAVKDIVMEEDEEKLTLATILYANDLVEVKST